MSESTFGQRVFRSARERVEVEYLKAKQAGHRDPILLIDARDQESRREKIEATRDLPEHLPMVHLHITLGTRSQIAEQVAKVSAAAGEDILNESPTEPTMTVAVITEGRVELFSEPEPF